MDLRHWKPSAQRRELTNEGDVHSCGDVGRTRWNGRAAEAIAGKRKGRLCAAMSFFAGRVGAIALRPELFDLDPRQDRRCIERWAVESPVR